MNFYSKRGKPGKQELIPLALLFAWISTTILGCGQQMNQPSHSHGGDRATVNASESKETMVEPRNEFGYAKVRTRNADSYLEGIVDAQGNEVIQPRSDMLVNDITDKVALVQFASKFLFVPLDQGSIPSQDFDSVNGFQYAEPFRCGLAMVSVNDTRFYINADFEKAFDAKFEFAESFHHDRALVMEDGHYRIIDTAGTTVASLDYDQVNLQSPLCWQVTKIEGDVYRSGFVGLDGKQITELIYDDVGYYDPLVKRIGVITAGLHGFLDEKASVAIPLIYEYAEPFDRGIAKVVLKGRAFFINPDGIEVQE